MLLRAIEEARWIAHGSLALLKQSYLPLQSFEVRFSKPAATVPQ